MAAENRGLVEVLGRRDLASMRPRRMAAENMEQCLGVMCEGQVLQ